MNLCITCQKETSNPKYCSKSCSAKDTNSKYPRRKLKPWYCKKCKVLLIRKKYRHQTQYCKDCNPRVIDYTKRTLSYYKKHASFMHNSIRAHANSVYHKSNKPKLCTYCGYNKHYEVCHIKPISSFNLETPMSIVNSIDNLIALCPNCHWELDNI